tara:strand:- start:382 stop:558 length:177 start_codon:yes stop_codon:yes gene_type:complete
MKNEFSFSEEEMNGIVEETYEKLIKSCRILIEETNCSNEQIVALLSVVASNFAPKSEK